MQLVCQRDFEFYRVLVRDTWTVYDQYTDGPCTDPTKRSVEPRTGYHIVIMHNQIRCLWTEIQKILICSESFQWQIFISVSKITSDYIDMGRFDKGSQYH